MIGLARCAGTGAPDEPFRPAVDPGALQGSIDLRPDPTVPDGWWLVRAGQATEDALGDDPDARLTATRRRRVEGRLGVSLDDRPLRRLVADLLLAGDDADPRRWNRLRPGADRWLRVWLGGLLWEAAVPSGGAISDNFDRADSSNIGSGWDEVSGNAEIVSSVLGSVQANTFTRVRTTGALAAADHWAQVKGVTYGTGGGTFKRLAPMVRYASAADTAYEWRRTYGNAGLSTDLTLATVRWHKIVTGTYTALGTDVTDTAAAGEVLRGEASGSTLTGLRDGTSKAAITDTSITTGTRAGVMVYSGTSAARIRGDDFTAGDLATSTGLVIADGSHGHLADAPALAQAHALVVADAGHAVASDQPSLTQLHALWVDTGEHGHSADVPPVTQAHTLDVGDTAHGHAADSLAVTQLHLLDTSGAAHGHVAEAAAVSVIYHLAVADAGHSHRADAAPLTQAHGLGVADAANGHLAGQLALAEVHALTVASATHAHLPDAVTVTAAAAARDVTITATVAPSAWAGTVDPSGWDAAVAPSPWAAATAD